MVFLIPIITSDLCLGLYLVIKCLIKINMAEGFESL